MPERYVVKVQESQFFPVTDVTSGDTKLIRIAVAFVTGLSECQNILSPQLLESFGKYSFVPPGSGIGPEHFV